MGHYNQEPSLLHAIQDLKTRVSALENVQGILTYTIATLPTPAPTATVIVYVSDGAAGQKYRGWNGTLWVNLG